MREQKKNKRARPCCRFRLQFTKYTVWPRDDDLVVEGLRLMTLPSGLRDYFILWLVIRSSRKTHFEYVFTISLYKGFFAVGGEFPNRTLLQYFSLVRAGFI